MKLTHKQKRYLKKNINKKPLGKISDDLNIPEEEIKKYFQKIWSKEKYKKFLTKQEKTAGGKYFSKKKLGFKAWISKNRWRILLLIILVIITYANSINNAFLSDDIGGIVNNTNLNSIKSVFSNPFAFFHIFVYYAVGRVLGRFPAAFRIVTIFFHLGSVLSLYFLLSLLFPPQVGFITALLFSVHPLLCESVVWISAGHSVYSAFWVLISFSFYILSARRKNIKQYWLSVFFYLLALGSSEKVIAFPIALVLYQISEKKLKKHWKKLMPFFFFFFIWGTSLLGAFGARTASLQKDFYQQIPKVTTPAQFITTTFRNTVVATVSYLGLIAWPKGLTLYHSEMHLTKIKYAAMVTIFLLYLGAIIYFYFHDKKVFFWLSFFIIILSPTLTPFGVSWIVAERYAYLPSVGIFVIIAYALNRLRKIKRGKVFLLLILGLVIIAFSARTIVRNIDWKDQDHLWLSAAKTSPSSPQNHNNLGDLYYRHHDLEKAIKEFKKATELNPNYAAAYHNLANAYYLQGKDIDAAIKNYQKAVAINPNLWQSYQNLGKIYFDQKDYPKAKNALEKAIQADPQNPAFYFNLAVIHTKIGENDEAKQLLETALKIDPDNQKAKEFLSTIP